MGTRSVVPWLRSDGPAVPGAVCAAAVVLSGDPGAAGEAGRISVAGNVVTWPDGRIGADGIHRVLGRASTDLIKSGGYRIGAGEVEHVLLAHPAVAEAAVVGAPHDDLGHEVVAYVVTRSEVTAAALIEFVATQLAAHKRPRRVVFLDALPRNAMGKVLKQSLG